MNDFAAALARAAQRRDETLSTALDGATGPIAEAMRYACTGGKALRAFLVLEGARLHGIEETQAVPAATAVECIHAYSLVHDDMPLMDDDDLRRGRPTVHRKWDEATALLTGDALQALAFEILGHEGLPDHARLALCVTLARAAGVRGMVGGQAQDIAAETADTPLTLEDIMALQAGKTGALIEWSASSGALMADADRAPLRAYGAALGLLFQITDDVLDVEGDAAAVGKSLGKDDIARKATFVSHLGLSGAKRRAQELVQSACDALESYGDRGDTLRAAAQFVLTRDR